MQIPNLFTQMLLIDSFQSVSRFRSVSMEKISTGFEINSAKDNPAATGVLSHFDIKMREQGKFTNAISEAQSYLGNQEFALKALSDILTRMHSVKVSADEAMALGQDIGVYQEEYIALQNEFIGITKEQFNGSPMFTSSASNEKYEFSLATGGRPFEITKYAVKAFMLGDSFSVGAASSTYFKIEKSLTWRQAQADAVSRGGHLAVYTTKEEYDKIERVGGNWGGWIGIEKPAGKPWISVTGEPVTFTPWIGGADGRPSQNNAAIIRKGGLVGNYRVNEVLGSYILEIESKVLKDVKSSDIASSLENIERAIVRNRAEQNKLSRIQNITESNMGNLADNSSRLEDLDYASEIVKKSKHDILMDHSLALLSQANIRSQSTLRLLYAKIDQEWEFSSRDPEHEQRSSKKDPVDKSFLSKDDEDTLRT